MKIKPCILMDQSGVRRMRVKHSKSAVRHVSIVWYHTGKNQSECTNSLKCLRMQNKVIYNQHNQNLCWTGMEIHGDSWESILAKILPASWFMQNNIIHHTNSNGLESVDYHKIQSLWICFGFLQGPVNFHPCILKTLLCLNSGLSKNVYR